MNGKQAGVEQMVDYLIDPSVVHRMIIASELELPVLTLIARDLEKNLIATRVFQLLFQRTKKMQQGDKMWEE